KGVSTLNRFTRRERTWGAPVMRPCSSRSAADSNSAEPNSATSVQNTRSGYTFFQRFQVPVHLGQRESDDVKVAAFDALDELGGEALNSIAAGLVHGLTGGDVVVDFGFGEGRKTHAGG